jgi:transposase
MKLKVLLNAAEKETLTQLCLNHQYKEVRKRAMGLLMLYSGKKLGTVQKELDISHQSVYNWITGWNTGGIAGLLNVSRFGGRPTKLPATWVESAVELATGAPYSVRQIAHLLEKQYEMPLPCSLRTLTRVLKAEGMTYKRTRSSLKKTQSDPV